MSYRFFGTIIDWTNTNLSSIAYPETSVSKIWITNVEGSFFEIVFETCRLTDAGQFTRMRMDFWFLCIDLTKYDRFTLLWAV